MEMKKGTVSVIPVKSLYNTKIPKAKLEIIPDEPLFGFPDGEYVDFEAGAKTPDTKITIGHRNTAIIDCGLTVSIPSGYRLLAHPTPNNAQRGLLITHVDNVDNRMRVIVTNVGKEIITLEHGEKFAIIHVEPICFVDWKNNQS